MALTVTKKKLAEEAKVEPIEVDEVQNLADMSDEDLADRYGSLEDQVTALKANPLFVQFDKVEKELRKRISEDGGLEPLDEASLEGNHWIIDIGPASKNNRKLLNGAIPKLQKMLGPETFSKIAKVNISDIEKYCTPSQVDQVVNSDTGFSTTRKITARFKG